MYALINEIYQGLHAAVTLEVSYAKILTQGFAANPQPVRNRNPQQWAALAE